MDRQVVEMRLRSVMQAQSSLRLPRNGRLPRRPAWRSEGGQEEHPQGLSGPLRDTSRKLLDPRCDLRDNASTGFAWGYNGSGPAQLALAILIDYFPTKPGGKALAEALYQPFKFTVIAALPDCWKMNFEEAGIALCRTLTDEPDLLNRVISSLESAVLDEIVGRQEKKEPLNPVDLSESIVGAITEMLSEAFSMSWAFAASLVERHYAGLHAPA